MLRGMLRLRESGKGFWGIGLPREPKSSLSVMSPFGAGFMTSSGRINICKRCIFFNRKWKRCDKCGCFIEIKARIPMFHCPIGKW